VNLWLDLDRASSVPLYHQLADQMERAIRSGELVPGTEIGNEIRLAERFGVSRPTMRQAILQLVEKGLLVRRRGVGTHVVNAPIARALRLTSLFDDLTAAEQRPRTALLASDVVPAPDEVAKAMSIAPQQPVLHLLRLRYAGDQPLAIMENYLPRAVVDLSGADLSTTGLYQALRDRGVCLKVATQRIGARTGSAEECRLLAEPTGSPMLTMDRITHDDNARVIEYGSHLYRASRYEYSVTLVER
jgi:DNA-binding GntR family transcriptional regulator